MLIQQLVTRRKRQPIHRILPTLQSELAQQRRQFLLAPVINQKPQRRNSDLAVTRRNAQCLAVVVPCGFCIALVLVILRAQHQKLRLQLCTLQVVFGKRFECTCLPRIVARLCINAKRQ